MKKLFIILLLLIGNNLYSQDKPYKVRANSFCEKHLENDTWTEFSDWKDTNYLIVMDGNKKRVTIYTDPIQTYDIITNEGESLSDRGEKTQNYMCVDEYGVNCRMRIIDRSQSINVIIDFSNLILCYNVIEID
jgi:hypothetical protein